MRYSNPLELPKNTTAIYQIVRKGLIDWEGNDTGDRYIGSAKNVRSRMQKHFSTLKKNKHHNKHLQAAWNKYGESEFYIEIIQLVSFQHRFTIEELHINAAKRMYKLYNIEYKTLYVKLNNQQIENLRRAKEKAIVVMDINGCFIEEHKSVSAAAKKYKCETSNISKSCNSIINGKFKYSSAGKLFCYKKNYDKTINYSYISEYTRNLENQIKVASKQVLQIDKEGNLIKEWNSAVEAGRYYKLHEGTISGACRKGEVIKGFVWKYK